MTHNYLAYKIISQADPDFVTHAMFSTIMLGKFWNAITQKLDSIYYSLKNIARKLITQCLVIYGYI